MKPAPEKITRRRALRAILALLAAPFFRGAARAESPRSPPFHHLPDGTFRNNHIGAIDKPFADLLKWRRESPGHPLQAYSVESPAGGLFLRPELRTLTWAGHATFLLRVGGMSVLTDPHFSMRASPFSFAGPRRGTPPSPRMGDLPKIDAAVISHNHYDHLDSESVRGLIARNPEIRFFCPLRVGDFCARGGRRMCARWTGAKARSTAGAVFGGAVPALEFAPAVGPQSNPVGVLGFGVPGFSLFVRWRHRLFSGFCGVGEKYGGFDWAALPIGLMSPGGSCARRMFRRRSR